MDYSPALSAAITLSKNPDGSLLNRKEIYNLVNYIDTMENNNIPHIFPKGTGKALENMYYIHIKRRFAFKRLLNAWFFKKHKHNIANEDDLLGNAFNMETYSKNRRILKLWDWNSRKFYLFTIADIIGSFKARLMNHDSPKHPANPYTNLQYTTSQISSIWEFLSKNGDRFMTNIESQVIMYYLRFQSIIIVHQIIHLLESPNCTMIKLLYPEIQSEKLLMESMVPTTNITEDKQDIIQTIIAALFTVITIESQDNVALIPSNKLEYYVYSAYLTKGAIKTIKMVKDLIQNNKKTLQICYRNYDTKKYDSIYLHLINEPTEKNNKKDLDESA